MRSHHVKVAVWYTLAWTVLVILWALQFGGALSPATTVDWPRAFGLSALNFYTTALVSAPLAYLVWRRGLHAATLYRSLLLYVVVAAAVSVVRFLLFVPLIDWIFGRTYGIWSDLRVAFAPQFAGELVVVAVVLAIRQVQLANELTKARLEALQAQLHPHFLFNTLHAVSTLMHRNVDEADEMLARLCDLLRSTLHQSQRAEIALSDELTILQEYVDIMERRFPGRLRLIVDVPPELRETRVPPLLFQPLVENVLQHGLGEGGTLTDVCVSVRRSDGALQVRVTDNGRGLAGEPPRLGIGLDNTRRRLETLYGRRARLKIEDAASGGTEVVLTIPYGAPA
jgi:two-component system LytT family sensor kinase